MENLNPLLNDRLIPAWNEFFAGDDPAVDAQRMAAAGVAAALWVAVAGAVIVMTLEWLSEIAIGSKK